MISGARAGSDLPEKWLRASFESSKDAVMIFDLDHVVVDANPAAETMFGWKRTEVVGRTITHRIHPARISDLARLQRQVEQELKSANGEGPVRFEWAEEIEDDPERPTGAGSRTRYISMAVHPVRDDDGSLLGFGAVFQDVTERRRAEAQRAAIARLSSVALQMSDVAEVFEAAVATPHAFLGATHVTLFEVSADRAHLVPVAQSGWVNPKMLRSFTVKLGDDGMLDEVVRTQEPAWSSDISVLVSEFAEGVAPESDLLIRSAIATSVSVRGSCWGILSATWSWPHSISPGEVAMLQTLANVVATVIERERNDRLRLQHERALRLGALGQMAAGVAHDLANVLASIEATAAAHLARSGPGFDEATRACIDRVISEAQLGHAIIDEILDFARLAPIAPEPVDLARWLAEQLPSLKMMVPGSARLEFECAPSGSGAIVSSDPARLRRVLANLVDNAGGAVSSIEGGVVTVRLSTETIRDGKLCGTELAPGSYARIDVADNGPGIDAEILPRVFEPFFTTKPHGKGTGLGLAQVHGIVLQHGGYVSVDSLCGQGSTFTIWLPLQPGEQ